MSANLTIFIDGACSGNPGEAGVGVVIKQDKEVVKTISQSIGPATNNIAEYTALIYALREAHQLKADVVKIYTDSELVYSQVTGKYKIKNDKLKSLYDQVAQEVKGFKRITIEHIVREKNKEADKLATQAINKAQDEVVASLFDNGGEESPSSKG